MHLIILRLVRAILIFLWLSHKSDISGFVGNRMTCFLKGRLNSFLNFTGALFQRRNSSKDKLSRLLNFIKKKKKVLWEGDTWKEVQYLLTAIINCACHRWNCKKKNQTEAQSLSDPKMRAWLICYLPKEKNIGPKYCCNWNNRAFKLVCHY